MEKIKLHNPFVKIWKYTFLANFTALISSIVTTLFIIKSSPIKEFCFIFIGISFAGTLISLYIYNLNIKTDRVQRELYKFLSDNEK